MLKVALTHDVDRTDKTYQCITHGLKSLKKGDIPSVKYHLLSWRHRRKVYWNFEDIISLENQYGAKSTFFFLIESMPFQLFKPSRWKLSLGRYNIQEHRIASIIRYLDKNGWDVNLHGSFESYHNPALLEGEKKLLENILGHKILGVRQHYLNPKKSVI
jgi:hypothetical protein